MEIKNASNHDDVVIVREADGERGGLVFLGIGLADHKPRHSNLSRAEARAVAYALLSYAEQVPAVVET
jgi:hypothetical protein